MTRTDAFIRVPVHDIETMKVEWDILLWLLCSSVAVGHNHRLLFNWAREAGYL